MAEKLEPKKIKECGDIGLWLETMEFQDGSKREMLVLTDTKIINFMKDAKNHNMYDVTYKSKTYFDKEKLKDLKEVLK